jgi:hypothetical protein
MQTFRKSNGGELEEEVDAEFHSCIYRYHQRLW